MERRAVVALLGSFVLAACGGGGGSPGAQGGPGAVQPDTPPAGAASNIAMWGDSLTPPVAAALQLLYPARVVFNGGVAGETSTQIAARQMADQSGRKAWINVFWYGQENPADPARIRADIASSVAALAPGNNRFLVVSVFNEAVPALRRGGALYPGLMQLNGELAAAYSLAFADLRTFLIGRYDPTSAQDRQDFQEDVVPSSLRIGTLDLNPEGARLAAAKIKEFIDGKGW